MGVQKQNGFGDVVLKQINDKLTQMLEKLNTEFECECLRHYLIGKGETMVLSDEIFQKVAAHVEPQFAAGKGIGSISYVTINGVKYRSQAISFYDNTDFDYAFGCSTVYFNAEGKAVGFRDIYDFDAAGHRKEMEEKLTELMGIIGKFLKAQPYDIVYGTYQ